MAKHHASSLSRAVSHVDLEAALLASQQDTSNPTKKIQDLTVRPKSPRPQEDKKSSDMDLQAENGSDAVISPQHPIAPPVTPAETNYDNENNETTHVDAKDDLNELGIQVVPAGAEAPKKKKKSSGKNKKAKPTGFEEFYADPPVTPTEFKEESQLYHEDIEFHQRIETAIQRYRARRNLDSDRSNILTKYLMLGGIESTNKTFTGGLDKETLDNSTTDEIRAINAKDYVSFGNKKYYDPNESKHWVVDFEGVASGFFSYRVPCMFSTSDKNRIKLYCSVVRNFLNYILAHNVCPEYNLDVMAARTICDKAETELWSVNEFRWAFPGDFNMAASTLCGGVFKEDQDGDKTWKGSGPDADAILKDDNRMSKARAMQIFKTAIDLEAKGAIVRNIANGDIHVVKTYTEYFEVEKIVRARKESIEDYASFKDADGQLGNIKALGKMFVKAWCGPNLDAKDYTDDEETLTESSVPEHLTEFWVEDEILEHVFFGMKMELRVHELNIGLYYFDTLGGPYCSFFQVMENEKMMDWKEPVSNTRPAPSVDNPNAEETMLFDDQDDEPKDDKKAGVHVNSEA